MSSPGVLICLASQERLTEMKAQMQKTIDEGVVTPETLEELQKLTDQFENEQRRSATLRQACTSEDENGVGVNAGGCGRSC